MEYIGEHVLPGLAGRFFVSLSFAAAIISAVSYFLYHRTQESGYKRIARYSFLAHAFGVFAIVGTLFYLMLNHYFEYDYIWKHSSLDLPGRYIFSAFWEGQEGSFILWMFWHAVLGLILMYTSKKLEAASMITFSLVQAFLASMILGIYIGDVNIGSSPFVLMRNARENIGLPWTEVLDYLNKFPIFMDGSGLNPLLQNYWMTIHPPTLFLGFASALPPFALAMGALFTRDYSNWVKPAIPWAYFSVMIFGTGILMGGAWAYEALSFGGFWAWDPVENSSLVPWLTMVGSAHLLLMYRNRKTGLSAAFFMTIFTFMLVLYSTFLTRSGILGDTSVHAFVDLGLSGQLLIYLLFFTVISYGLFFARWKHLPKSKTDDELSSREFWMFIGSLVLMISAFQIIFSTSIPVINALIGPDGLVPMRSEKMAPPLDAIQHYNLWQIPFSIVITFLIGFAQFLNYKKTSSKLFWKRITRSVIISVVATLAVAYAFDFWKQPLYLTLLFTGLFAAISNLDYWLIVGKGNFKLSGSSIAHVGFALVMVGSLLSNAKKEIISNTNVFLSEDLPSSENALLELGDTTALSNYQIVFNGMREEKDKQFYDVSYYSKTENGLQKEFDLSPFLQMSDNMGPTPNPDTEHFWEKDIYTHVTYSSYLDPQTGDGYASEMEIMMQEGDTAIYQRHFVIMDSVKVKVAFNQETQELARLRLTAKLRIINVLGEEYVARPVYLLEGNSLSHEDAILEAQKFKFRLSDIDREDTNSKRFKITAWTEVDPNEKPFIIMKAIVFPMINVLWIGCVLMAIGSGIAVWQRIKKA
jgi:cytochrome c-type biogenesis protein CcmF